MFRPGDRIAHPKRQGTYEFMEYVGRRFNRIRARNRLGAMFVTPLARWTRAPLIVQEDGSLGYEFWPGQPVQALHPTQGKLLPAQVRRYVPQDEGQPDQIEVEWADRSLGLTVVPVDGLMPHPNWQPNYFGAESSLDFVLQLKLEELLQRLNFRSIDWRGHWRSGARWLEDQGWYQPLDQRVEELSQVRLYKTTLTSEQAERLVGAIQAGTPLPDDEWLPCGRPISNAYFQCSYCGVDSHDQHFETNGVQVRVALPCPNPEGNVVNEFELNVPSGRLAVANDLRSLAPIRERGKGLGGPWWSYQLTDLYAQAGMAHGFVGNTCPNVYRLQDGTFVVGDFSDEQYEPDLPEGSEVVAGIITDLWWYSIMDHDLAQRRARALCGQDELGSHITVVDVEPGVYRFRNYNDLNRDAPKVVCAEFERIGPPRDEEDTYLARWQSEHVDARLYLAQKIRDWPSLYDKGDETSSIAAAANHCLCTNGNGEEFHPNGHPITHVDPDTLPVAAIPRFDWPKTWYPLSPGFSALFRAAGLQAGPPYGPGPGHYGEHLNESFQELAYRVLQSIISYGQAVSLTQRDHRETQLVEARRIMTNCMAAYHALAERYPETWPNFDPQFHAWMADQKRVKAWIKAVPLTPDKPSAQVRAVQRAGLVGAD